MSGERGVCLRFVSRRMESTRCDVDFLSARVSPRHQDGNRLCAENFARKNN